MFELLSNYFSNFFCFNKACSSLLTVNNLPHEFKTAKTKWCFKKKKERGAKTSLLLLSPSWRGICALCGITKGGLPQLQYVVTTV